MRQFRLKFYLLRIEICANFCKSICVNNDKIMGNWAAKILKALYNRKTVPNYVKVQLLYLEICANFCKSIYDDKYKIMGTWDANITE